jgi:ribonuclease HI
MHSTSTFNLRMVDLICQPSTYCFNHPPPSLAHWLLPETISIIQELSNQGPIAIYTDGSWSQAGSHWDHITLNLPSFSGSVGVVIMSDLPHWKDLPIISLQVTDGQKLDSLSAFSMESFGILVALSIASSLLDPEVTIFTDCQSAVKKLHKLRNKPTIRTKSRDASITLSSLRHWSLLGPGVQIKWVKGHPERSQPDASLWSRDMWGNHLADRAAAGCLQTVSYQYDNLYSNELLLTPLLPFDALTLSPSLAPPGMWYFGNTQRQLISPSVVDRVQSRRFDGYLKKRDDNRQLRDNLPPKWAEINFPLAAKLWKSNSTTFMRNRILFDKHWHPGNQAKKAKDTNTRLLMSKCPFCPYSDSLSHWSHQCMAIPRSLKLRSRALDSIRASVAEFYKQHKNDPSLQSSIVYLSEHYLSFLTGPDVLSEAWTGTWSSLLLDSFRIPSQTLPYTHVNILRKLFLTIGGIVADAVVILWQSRQLALTELARRMREEPDPSYTEPPFLHTPSNLDLIPLTRDELTALRTSALAPVILPPIRISLHKTTRKVKAVVTVVSEEVLEGSSPLSISNGDTLPVALPSELTSKSGLTPYLRLFKQSKKKRPKAHPQLTLPQRFNITQIRNNRKKRKGALVPSDSANTPNPLTLLKAGPVIVPFQLLDNGETTAVLPSPPRKSKRRRGNPSTSAISGDISTTPRCTSLATSISFTSPDDPKLGAQNPILGDDPG